MHIIKREEVVFLSYFAILLLFVINIMMTNVTIISIAYLVVILISVLKFVFIVNYDKK